MRVLVTGGSGFLGGALIGRLVSQGHDVLALARNEGQLIKLKDKYPLITIMSGDVADRSICREAMWGIEGVYHLAAFKHVRLAEEQPKECISTNVIGSKEILTAALEQKVLFLLAVSTDKAAQVSGIYGASKLCMEGMWRQMEVSNPATKLRIVRYGNVLGSTGSILPRWKELLEKREPIVVTDPDATRFYFTVGQAVDLIFECIDKAEDARPYIPYMKSVRLSDLAEAMITKYGDGVFRVKEIGLQIGENKHESLDGRVYSNEVQQYNQAELAEMI